MCFRYKGRILFIPFQVVKIFCFYACFLSCFSLSLLNVPTIGSRNLKLHLHKEDEREKGMETSRMSKYKKFVNNSQTVLV